MTSICDPEASQLNDAAGQTVVFCYDGLLLGFRALSTAVSDIDRLYLRRAPCAQIPCLRRELAVIIVTGWVEGIAWSVAIDWDSNTITVPALDAAAAWPTSSTQSVPLLEPPQFPSAPESVRNRQPLPYCGDATDRDRAEVLDCFLAAFLDGKPVEMIERSPVTGDVSIIRFGGRGMLVGFKEDAGEWFRDAGSLVLGPDPTSWSYHNWLRGKPIR